MQSPAKIRRLREESAEMGRRRGWGSVTKSKAGMEGEQGGRRKYQINLNSALGNWEEIRKNGNDRGGDPISRQQIAVN